MHMKELLLGTVVIVGLFSSAYANDKGSCRRCGIRSFWWHLCNLTINTKAAAKYHNDELKERTITASVLADIKAAADPVERSVKDDINCRKVRGIYAGGVIVSLWPANLSAHTAMVNRTVLHVNLTVDRSRLGVAEFLELVRQFIKCLFCMLIQMPADLQFHFGNLRIGLPLRVPDPIFRCLDDIAVNLRQM